MCHVLFFTSCICPFPVFLPVLLSLSLPIYICVFLNCSLTPCQSCVPCVPSTSLVYTVFSFCIFATSLFLSFSPASSVFVVWQSTHYSSLFLVSPSCVHMSRVWVPFFFFNPDKIWDSSEQTAVTTKVPSSNIPKLITLQWYQTGKGRKSREHFAFSHNYCLWDNY